MTSEEFEFLLFDRIEKIKQINAEYDLENNAYISFSGGGDSTILHYLIDLALPNNKIPRLFINTGIEYQDIVEYVKELASKDDRILIVNSGINIKQMLEKYGYPFKSKQHSHNLAIYQRSGLIKTIRVYLGNELTSTNKTAYIKCPKMFEYQFTEKFTLKCSEQCCYKLKKEPASKWAKLNNKTITITGMRSDEGGSRTNLSCITHNGKKFHPLIVVNDDFKNKFLNKYNIKLCRLYYEPYNFKRTGCKGCPFALKLQDELNALKKLLPKEYKQCEKIWKPVYDEYRRIGYRLRKDTGQLTIFDFIESE
jgi:3'-phosphoadenosine 5'-phosphosulfate sulfotransferase (PAPS reductase)/FAD synthetase